MLDNSGLCHCKGLDELISSFYGKDLSGGEVVKPFAEAYFVTQQHYVCIQKSGLVEGFIKKNI